MAYFRIFILQKNINLFFGSTFGSLRGRRSGGKGLLLPRPPFRCSATGWPSAAGYTFGNSHLPQLFCLHQPMNSWRYNHCVRSRSIFVSTSFPGLQCEDEGRDEEIQSLCTFTFNIRINHVKVSVSSADQR